jgi:hypothetical protein
MHRSFSPRFGEIVSALGAELRATDHEESDPQADALADHAVQYLYGTRNCSRIADLPGGLQRAAKDF